MIYTFETLFEKGLSDTNTPVELYLKLRDSFPNCFLLESSEYKTRENSYSYICLGPTASFVTDRSSTTIEYPDGKKSVMLNNHIDTAFELNSFLGSFDIKDPGLGFTTSGLFGYTSYDAIPLFEDIKFSNKSFDLPLIQYHFFRFLIVFNHFNNEIFILEHLLNGEQSEMEVLKSIIAKRAVTHFRFKANDCESSNFEDRDLLKAINKAIEHCLAGDVFQLVLSRKFRKSFKGDEFNVYRALRSINPSAYLFYFDYGDFKIFGSSPEAQLKIQNKTAVMHPIAGTYKRTGNKEHDEKLAVLLSRDPKENAEHVMLVDLARNDLSKNSRDVQVEAFKQVEYYSHVIHMVSKVSARLEAGFNPMRIFADSFPAGTLSGAPKYKAMQIIDDNEQESRGFYGGAVGLIGFDGSFNHAIFIRSFLSRNNELTYQAGCGIVAKSDPESELQEINNKLLALRKAIELANTL